MQDKPPAFSSSVSFLRITDTNIGDRVAASSQALHHQMPAECVLPTVYNVLSTPVMLSDLAELILDPVWLCHTNVSCAAKQHTGAIFNRIHSEHLPL